MGSTELDGDKGMVSSADTPRVPVVHAKRPWDQQREHLESQLKDLPIWSRDPDLCEEGLQILERWHEHFDQPTWRRIEKRAAKELNEAQPCLRYASEWLSAIGSGVDGGDSSAAAQATIVDLCSGFGITSMFLSELLPADSVSRIWLLDKMWPCSNDDGPKKVNVNHLTQREWPIPLRLRKTDIKAGREMRQVQKYVVEPSQGPVLVLGIHLCKALSIHAIKLYQSSDKITAMVLKPCCLPGKGMMFRRNPIVWKFGNGYEFQPRDVYEGDEWRSAKGRDTVDTEGSENTEDKETSSAGVDQASDGPGDEAREIEKGKNKLISGGHDLKNHTNERFSRWVGHLSRACDGDSCRVCVKHIDITKHHFQNQFIFCEQISSNETVVDA